MAEHMGMGGGAGGVEALRHDADDKAAGDDAIPMGHRRKGKREGKRKVRHGKREGARK